LAGLCVQKQKTHQPGIFSAVGPWACVLRLDRYIPSAPEDTRAPQVRHVQASARFFASKLISSLLNEDCLAVNSYFSSENDVKHFAYGFGPSLIRSLGWISAHSLGFGNLNNAPVVNRQKHGSIADSPNGERQLFQQLSFARG
jgi:hypothetical protein